MPRGKKQYQKLGLIINIMDSKEVNATGVGTRIIMGVTQNAQPKVKYAKHVGVLITLRRSAAQKKRKKRKKSLMKNRKTKHTRAIEAESDSNSED